MPCYKIFIQTIIERTSYFGHIYCNQLEWICIFCKIKIEKNYDIFSWLCNLQLLLKKSVCTWDRYPGPWYKSFIMAGKKMKWLQFPIVLKCKCPSLFVCIPIPIKENSTFNSSGTSQVPTDGGEMEHLGISFQGNSTWMYSQHCEKIWLALFWWWP